MKKIQIEIKWALIFVVMMLLWMVMEKLMGFHDVNIAKHSIITNFVAIPAIIVYVIALKDKKNNDYNGTMTYKEGFISGLIISLIVTIFTPLSQYITSTLITPDYFENVIQFTVAMNIMSQEKAESYFNLQNYIIQSTFATPIMGIITTAAVAFFVRSKNS